MKAIVMKSAHRQSEEKGEWKKKSRESIDKEIGLTNEKKKGREDFMPDWPNIMMSVSFNSSTNLLSSDSANKFMINGTTFMNG